MPILLLPVLAASICCESGSPSRGGPTDQTGNGATNPTSRKLMSKPKVTAEISRVQVNWKEEQQTFLLTLINNGDKSEKVHALVYARNDEIDPPRRAISPATAFHWFELAQSKEGDLSYRDIERNWKAGGFVSARGSLLKKTWDAIVRPGEKTEIEAAHHLERDSPHPTTKGKRLVHAGYKEYEIWLFTPDGTCFFDQTVPAKPPANN